MKIRPLFLAPFAVLALLLAACGSDDGGRPSASELSQQLQDADDEDALTEEEADCVAAAFVDSDLSDEALRAIRDYDGNPQSFNESDLSDDDRAAAQAAQGAAIDCFDLPELPESPELPDPEEGPTTEG